MIKIVIHSVTVLLKDSIRLLRKLSSLFPFVLRTHRIPDPDYTLTTICVGRHPSALLPLTIFSSVSLCQLLYLQVSRNYHFSRPKKGDQHLRHP